MPERSPVGHVSQGSGSATLVPGFSAVVAGVGLAIRLRIAGGALGADRRRELVGDGDEGGGLCGDLKRIVRRTSVEPIGNRTGNKRDVPDANERREVGRDLGCRCRSNQVCGESRRATVINDAIKPAYGSSVAIGQRGDGRVSGSGGRSCNDTTTRYGARQVGTAFDLDDVGSVHSDPDGDIGQRTERGIELWDRIGQRPIRDRREHSERVGYGCCAQPNEHAEQHDDGLQDTFHMRCDGVVFVKIVNS